MTLFWIAFVFIVAWSLGRAQLRAEIADRELSKRRQHEATSGWNRRGYDR